MSVIGNGWINCSAFEKSRIRKTKGGNQGFAFQFALNDETDDYGNNVTLWMTQTEAERESKAKRIFIGNGRAQFNNGKLTIVSKDNPEGTTLKVGDGTDTQVAKEVAGGDGLPF